MLKKKEGVKLELSDKEKSKVYGGDCGQPCAGSCPIDPIHKKYCDFRVAYLEWAASPFPVTG